MIIWLIWPITSYTIYLWSRNVWKTTRNEERSRTKEQSFSQKRTAFLLGISFGFRLFVIHYSFRPQLTYHHHWIPLSEPCSNCFGIPKMKLDVQNINWEFRSLDINLTSREKCFKTKENKKRRKNEWSCLYLFRPVQACFESKQASTSSYITLMTVSPPSR